MFAGAYRFKQALDAPLASCTSLEDFKASSNAARAEVREKARYRISRSRRRQPHYLCTQLSSSQFPGASAALKARTELTRDTDQERALRAAEFLRVVFKQSLFSTPVGISVKRENPLGNFHLFRHEIFAVTADDRRPSETKRRMFTLERRAHDPFWSNLFCVLLDPEIGARPAVVGDACAPAAAAARADPGE